jgi:5-methylcytosine-specific restriction endonuclease McrA
MSKFKCTICEKVLSNYNGLAKHSARMHNIKGEELYMLHNNITEKPKCKCGCGEELNYFPTFGYGEYIRGHIAKVTGGFYSEDGNRKAHETRRERFKTGEIIQWNKGKHYTTEQLEIYQKAWSNPTRNKKISEAMKNISVQKQGYKNWDEWYNSLSDREQYYHTVRILTEQNAHLIPNNIETKRGLAGVKGAHHIDHIIPITKGYKNNITPEQIADVSNLQFIPWEENLKKGPR